MHKIPRITNVRSLIWLMSLALLASVIFLERTTTVAAQWTTPDANNNIHNTNTNNVGVAVGSSAPESRLTVGDNVIGFSGQTTSMGIISTLSGNTYDRALFVAPKQTAAASGNSILIYSYPRIATGITQSKQYGIYIDTNQGGGAITNYYPAVFMGGNVGIGMTSPQGILDVVEYKPGNSLVRFANGDSNGSTSLRLGTWAVSNTTKFMNLEFVDHDYWVGSVAGDRQSGLRLRTGVNGGSEAALSDRLIISPTGNIGIGKSPTSYLLDVNGSVNATGFTVNGAAFTSSQWATSGTSINYATGNVGIGTSSPSTKLDVAGNVNVAGNITATGSVTSTYQDVAEWVPSSRIIPAATVVTLDPSKSNQVLPSSQAYDTRVAGVVSARPGLVLGEAGENRVLVATTGRVKVKVDATRAPIHVGDLLVTSDREGAAMKSEPVNIGSVQIHRPGTLIGKALEPLESGTGEILVLLSLQ